MTPNALEFLKGAYHDCGQCVVTVKPGDDNAVEWFKTWVLEQAYSKISILFSVALSVCQKEWRECLNNSWDVQWDPILVAVVLFVVCIDKWYTVI